MAGRFHTPAKIAPALVPEHSTLSGHPDPETLDRRQTDLSATGEEKVAKRTLFFSGFQPARAKSAAGKVRRVHHRSADSRGVRSWDAPCLAAFARHGKPASSTTSRLRSFGVAQRFKRCDPSFLWQSGYSHRGASLVNVYFCFFSHSSRDIAFSCSMLLPCSAVFNGGKADPVIDWNS